MDDHTDQPATLDQLLALTDPTPAQEQRLRESIATRLPTVADLRRTEPVPPELTALFLNRQRAIRKRRTQMQRHARLSLWLATQTPGTYRP